MQGPLAAPQTWSCWEVSTVPFSCLTTLGDWGREGFFLSTAVGLGGPGSVPAAASEPISVDESGRKVRQGPASWPCSPGLALLHARWGEGLSWPQPGWWDLKAEPAKSRGVRLHQALPAAGGAFACGGTRWPEAEAKLQALSGGDTQEPGWVRGFW